MHQSLPNITPPELTLPPAMESAIEFLKLMTPEGQFNYGVSHIGATTFNAKMNKYIWRDEVHGGFYTMVQRCFALSEAGDNTYYALSVFQQGWHEVVQRDGQIKKRFRIQENATFQKALWLDVDCGKNDSPYNNEQDVLRALQLFLEATRLPVPSVVFSGKGVHLYWPFHESIPTEAWTVMAKMLKNLTVHFGFVADHSRTTDPSSVLRIPGTRNYGKNMDRNDPVTWQLKAGPYHVVDIAGILLQSTKDHNVQPATPQPAKTTMPVAPIGAPLPPPPAGLAFGNLEEAFQGPKRHPLRIIKECKQIQSAGLGTYTQWYNMMLVLKHCAFGERAIHDISKMDTVRYDMNNVQEKYQQAIDGGYGPCRCETFNEKDPGICTSCPYWGKITTPLMLGEIHQEAKPVSIPIATVAPATTVAVVSVDAPTMEVLPFNTKEFSVVPGQGVIWHKRELTNSGIGVDPDEDNKQYIVKDILICDTELYIHSVCIDNTTSEVKRSYVIRKQAQERAPEDILFDIDSDFSTHSMIKWLGQHAMIPKSPKYHKVMCDFMNTYLAAVQNRLPEIIVRETFGWVNNNDKLTGTKYKSFVAGTQMYSHKGDSSVKLTERAADFANSHIRQSGSLDEWKRAAQMYRILNQPFPMLEICSGFGSVLMEFNSGVATNCAYNLWDVRGGRGKTHILYTIAAMWGPYKNYVMTRRDTLASRYQMYATFRNLPMLTDEITNMTEAEMSDLAFDAVNGKEKSRSASSGRGVIQGGTWNTNSFFTSNRSLYAAFRNYNAQMQSTSMRLIEWQWDYPDYGGTDTGVWIKDTLKVLDQNYGWAGPAFLKFIFDHPELLEWAPRYAADWANKNTLRDDERFWVHSIGAGIAGGRIACAAGLLDYDMDWLSDWCSRVLLPVLRDKVNSMRPTGINLLADYFNEHHNNTLVVSSAKRPANQPDPGVDSTIDPYIKKMPTGPLKNRIEYDTRLAYVPVRHFNSYHGQCGLSVDATLQDLANAGGYSHKNGRVQYSLGSGVSVLERARTMCYVFNLLKLEEVFEQVAGETNE